MKKRSFYLTLVAVLLVAGGLLSPLQAEVREMTRLVLTEPTDVGGTLVSPGMYLIRVVPLDSTRNILQVTNQDRSEVVATVLSVPHALPPAERDSDNAQFVFYPATDRSPRALRTWYAPDPVSDGGHDIVYPESRAMEIANASRDSVVAYSGVQKNQEQLESADLEVISPDETLLAESSDQTDESMTQLSEAEEPSLAEDHEQLAMNGEISDEETQLPRTAGHGPLLFLLGSLSLVGAAGVRRFHA